MRLIIQLLVSLGTTIGAVAGLVYLFDEFAQMPPRDYVVTLISYMGERYAAVSTHLAEPTPVPWILVLLAPVSLVAVLLWALVVRRRGISKTATPKRCEIKIEKILADYRLHVKDDVYGKSLKYVEAERSGPYMFIVIHGLGLDAADFLETVRASSFHVVAVTLFGFNQIESNDTDYINLPIETHAALVGAFIRYMARIREKRVVCCGFSLGADLLLLMEDSEIPLPSEIHAGTILLDCNINQTTINICKRIAGIKTSDFVERTKSLSRDIEDPIEYVNMLWYICRISSKSIERIGKFAADCAQYWEQETATDKFVKLVWNFKKNDKACDVMMSKHYRTEFEKVFEKREMLLPHVRLEPVSIGHFELIEQEYLECVFEEMVKRLEQGEIRASVEPR